MTQLEIPKIIHQTWKTADVPERFSAFQCSWRQHLPDWEYRLWTDADNERLIARSYPEYFDFYRQLPYPILRVEFVKLAYLDQFGGLYVDLDFESLKPITPLLADAQIVLGREAGGLGGWTRGRDYILNALMASMPGHSFWRSLMEVVVARHRPKRPWDLHIMYIVEAVIARLDELAEARIREHDDLRVYPSDVFYPATQLERSIDVRRQLATQRGSYAIHHYDDSWFTPGMKLLTTLRYAVHRVLPISGRRAA